MNVGRKMLLLLDRSDARSETVVSIAAYEEVVHFTVYNVDVLYRAKS